MRFASTKRHLKAFIYIQLHNLRVFIASSDEMMESDIAGIPNSLLLIEGKLI